MKSSVLIWLLCLGACGLIQHASTQQISVPSFLAAAYVMIVGIVLLVKGKVILSFFFPAYCLQQSQLEALQAAHTFRNLQGLVQEKQNQLIVQRARIHCISPALEAQYDRLMACYAEQQAELKQSREAVSHYRRGLLDLQEELTLKKQMDDPCFWQTLRQGKTIFAQMLPPTHDARTGSVRHRIGELKSKLHTQLLPSCSCYADILKPKTIFDRWSNQFQTTLNQAAWNDKDFV